MSNIELEDNIVLAKFLNYMQKALYHRRLNCFRDFSRPAYERLLDELYAKIFNAVIVKYL